MFSFLWAEQLLPENRAEEKRLIHVAALVGWLGVRSTFLWIFIMLIKMQIFSRSGDSF